MKREVAGSLIVTLLVGSGLWGILVKDEFSNRSSSTKTHHSIVCRFQLDSFLIALKDFSRRTGRYPAKLKELYPTELQRVPICPLTGSPYDDGYSPTDGCRDFVLRCSTGEGPFFTSKDINELKEIRRSSSNHSRP